MNPSLLTQLVFPLIAAAVLAALVHLQWPADGFFLNLAAGFVGSLVTVGYVDWILRRHEKERWKEADTRIKNRLSKLASSTITGIRTCFGFGTELFDQKKLMKGDPEVMRVEVLRIAVDVLSPKSNERVAALNQAQWQSFIAHLQKSATECGIILDRFGRRLEPCTTSTLLDMQQYLESAQTFWQVFPDIAGVPTVELPQTNRPPEELQAAWCELTAEDIRKVLELATKLSTLNRPGFRGGPLG